MKFPPASITESECLSRCCQSRLHELWRETGDDNLLRVSEGRQPLGMARLQTARDQMDAVSSCLMTTYQKTGNVDAFDLLVELNRDSLLMIIRQKLRGNSRVDAQDVLQEALLSMCRYRKSFRGDTPGAFRRWGHRIAVNTACRLFLRESRGVPVALDEDIGREIEDRSARSPFRSASEAERAKLVDLAYVTYLNLYLLQYRQRSPKEQRALAMVELEGASYRETAAELGIRIETLKMLIFRVRRKIERGVARHLSA